MRPGLSPEQRDLQEAIRRFCKEETARRQGLHLPADAEQRLHDRELYTRLADIGWVGVAIPESYGGGGGGLTDLCIVLEETARGRLPLDGFQVSLIVAAVLGRYGNEKQKTSALAGIARGEVASIAMSEPEAGSDLGAIACRAARDGDHFTINGQKTWTSAAHLAGYILLVARTGERPPRRSRFDGMTMLLLPTDLDGLTIRPIETMGGHEVNELFFTDCRVPSSAVVGEVDDGWRQLTAGLNHERVIVAAQALGMAAGSLDQTIDYVSTREQFGRKVGSYQAISHRIADLATEIEACRALVYAVAAAMDTDPRATLPREAAMAKLKATELCKRVALEGMQMMGGIGYARESGMEEQVRRALKMTIGGGTSEIQRDLIAKTLGLGRP